MAYQRPADLPEDRQKWRVSWQRPAYWLLELVADDGTTTSWLFDEVRLEGVTVWTETRRQSPEAAWLWTDGVVRAVGDEHHDSYFSATVGGLAVVSLATGPTRPEEEKAE